MAEIKYKRGQNPNSRNGFKNGHKTNVGRVVSQETKTKIGKANKVSVKLYYERGGTTWNIGGGKYTDEMKLKMSKAQKQRFKTEKPWNYRLKGYLSGEQNHNWRGGITPLNRYLRTCFEYRLWRTKVFERDNFTCQECKTRGGVLNVDHIKPFSLVLHEYSIASYEEAQSCRELWDIDNGRTLCKGCHLKTDTFGYLATKKIISLKNK